MFEEHQNADDLRLNPDKLRANNLKISSQIESTAMQ
jgi:hypothetical protein